MKPLLKGVIITHMHEERIVDYPQKGTQYSALLTECLHSAVQAALNTYAMGSMVFLGHHVRNVKLLYLSPV